MMAPDAARSGKKERTTRVIFQLNTNAMTKPATKIERYWTAEPTLSLIPPW
jgi:hypothetical protein